MGGTSHGCNMMKRGGEQWAAGGGDGDVGGEPATHGRAPNRMRGPPTPPLHSRYPPPSRVCPARALDANKIHRASRRAAWQWGERGVLPSRLGEAWQGWPRVRGDPAVHTHEEGGRGVAAAGAASATGPPGLPVDPAAATPAAGGAVSTAAAAGVVSPSGPRPPAFPRRDNPVRYASPTPP